MTARALLILSVLFAFGCTSGGQTSAGVEEGVQPDEALEEALDRIATLESENADLRAEIEETEAASARTTTTSTATPTETATGEPAAESGRGVGGTRENPVPLGEVAQVGEYEVRVVDVIPNANEQVAAANRFNDPPAAGRQFFMVSLEATYTGTETGIFWVDTNAAVIGSANVAYGNQSEAVCGVAPNEIGDQGEQFAGGTIVGNECWSVPSDEVDGLVLALSATFDDRVFFALR